MARGRGTEISCASDLSAKRKLYMYVRGISYKACVAAVRISLKGSAVVDHNITSICVVEASVRFTVWSLNPKSDLQTTYNGEKKISYIGEKKL